MTKHHSNAIRAAILAELDRRGWSKNRLAIQAAATGRITHGFVHRYLSGKADMTTNKVSVLLKILKMKVK